MQIGPLRHHDVLGLNSMYILNNKDSESAIFKLDMSEIWRKCQSLIIKYFYLNPGVDLRVKVGQDL